jgi:serine/threonine protein phosphatase 1
MITVGDYAFVHAGVRPGVPLDQQAERDLLWIRQEFLAQRGRFEKVIVHGHTPMQAPQLTPFRLGVDTGAYATGVLTAVRLEGETQRVMQARARRPVAV